MLQVVFYMFSSFGINYPVSKSRVASITMDDLVRNCHSTHIGVETIEVTKGTLVVVSSPLQVLGSVVIIQSHRRKVELWVW